jgi:hypothetical protein
MRTQSNQTWSDFILDKNILNILTISDLKSLLGKLGAKYNSSMGKNSLLDFFVVTVAPFVGTKVDPGILDLYEDTLSDLVYNRNRSTAKDLLIKLLECLCMSTDLPIKDFQVYLGENIGEYKINTESMKDYVTKNIDHYGYYHTKDIYPFTDVDLKKVRKALHRNYYITNKEWQYHKDNYMYIDPDLIYEKDLPNDWLDSLKLYQYEYATTEDKDELVKPLIPGCEVSIFNVDKMFPMAMLTKGNFTLSLPPYGMEALSFDDCTIKSKDIRDTILLKEGDILKEFSSRLVGFIISKYGANIELSNSGSNIFNGNKNYIKKTVCDPSKLVKIIQDNPITNEEREYLECTWMEHYIYKRMYTDPESLILRNYYGDIIYVQDYVNNYLELKKECMSELIPRFNRALADVNIESYDALIFSLERRDSANVIVREAILHAQEEGSGDFEESYNTVRDFFLYIPNQSEIFIDRFNYISAVIIAFSDMAIDDIDSSFLLFYRDMFVVGHIKDTIDGATPLQETLFTHLSMDTIKTYLKIQGCEYIKHMNLSDCISTLCRGYMKPTVISKTRLKIISKNEKKASRQP